MPRPAVPLDPERLLQEDPFVRGLARQLLRDDDRADDLAQTTWLELLRKPLSAETPRTLLATIVRRLAHKQRRGERRTERREREQPPADPVPSPREILEREETRSRVVRAVLTLPAEMRDVVVLRFFENLPPRAIAKRLSIPVETVRTRHKRAIARLREELDATTDGGRAAWSAALVPFAMPAAQGAAAAFVFGGLFMAAKGKAAAIAALCVFALGCWWMSAHDESDAISTDARSDVVASEGPPVEDAAANARAASTPPESAPTRIEASTARTTGDVVVRVVTKQGENAIAKQGVFVELVEQGPRHATSQKAVTDDAGRVLFRDLAPARYELELPGRSCAPEWVVAEVRAGETAEHTLQLVRGIALHGVVVDDHGTPLADAEVVVADFVGDRSWGVASTGPDGRFAIDAVRRQCNVGARRVGFEPSFLQQVSAEHGATVELRIELARGGAALRGVVRDEGGMPLAGATIVVGSHQQEWRPRSDGGSEMAPRPVTTSSDAEGRYAMTPLRPGATPVLVWKQGRSPATARVALVEGSELRHDVVLEREAALEGTVRDDAGSACANARIRAGSWDDLDHVEATTDAQGAFALRELPLREFEVVAEARDGRTVSATFQPRAGELLRWDAVLVASRTIRGRVLDDQGRPIAQLHLEARTDDYLWEHRVRTDEDGAFTLQGFPAQAIVSVRPWRFSMFPETIFDGLVARAEEYVLRMPPRREVHLSGRVLLPDGKVPQNLSLMPVWAAGGEGSPVEQADPATGAFRLGPYPAGSYQLLIESPGHARIALPPRVVEEDLDYGTITLEVGGTAKVNLQWNGAGPLPRHWAVATTRDGVAIARVEGSNSTVQLPAMPTGDYVLQLGGDGFVNQQLPLAIANGVETVLDVPVRPGVRVELHLSLPQGSRGRTDVQVVAEDGRTVLRTSLWALRGEARTTAMLDLGRYRVKAQNGAVAGEGQFDLASGAAAVWDLVLR